MNKDLVNNSVSNLYNLCQLVESHRLPISHVHVKALAIFDIIHVDLWGPFPMISSQNMRYLLFLVDDCIMFIWIYFLNNKTRIAFVLLHFELLWKVVLNKN